MKKIFKISLFAALFMSFVVVAVVFGDKSGDTANADEDFAFVLNEKSENLPDGFLNNQFEASKITTRFFETLNEKYGTNTEDDVYTVNGICAKDYPAYFAGTFINTEGRLIVQIVENYYSEDYRETEWYQEFVEMVQSEKFACHPVKYSYGELIEAISSVTLGDIKDELSKRGVSIVDAGINDYLNKVEIGVRNQEEYEIITDFLKSDIYSVSIVDYEPQDNIGVYAGEGVTESSTGTYTFSVACRARRLLPGGIYSYGYLTCAHVFSGASNVYINTGSGTNTLIGSSPSSLQKRGGKADVAFITTNSNITLYNTIYMSTTTLNANYSSSIGSVVYKRGESSGVTGGTVLDSSYETNVGGYSFTDLVKTSYYSIPGDSGGIVYSQPNSENYAYSVGIHKGNNVSLSGSVINSFFTKMSNDLAALQGTGTPIPVYTY